MVEGRKVIFLLLFGIFAGVYQLWMLVWAIGVSWGGNTPDVKVGLGPGIVSVLLIGTYLMLA